MIKGRLYEKVWFIWNQGKEEGPLSIADLRAHPDVTPDILGRREDVREWRPLKEIPELKDLFKDSINPLDPLEISPSKTSEELGEEITLDIHQDPSSFYLWIILILMILLLILLNYLE